MRPAGRARTKLNLRPGPSPSTSISNPRTVRSASGSSSARATSATKSLPPRCAQSCAASRPARSHPPPPNSLTPTPAQVSYGRSPPRRTPGNHAWRAGADPPPVRPAKDVSTAGVSPAPLLSFLAAYLLRLRKLRRHLDEIHSHRIKSRERLSRCRRELPVRPVFKRPRHVTGLQSKSLRRVQIQRMRRHHHHFSRLATEQVHRAQVNFPVRLEMVEEIR